MKKYYSPTTRGFYAEELRADYEAAGTWPSDAYEVTTEEEVELRKPAAPSIDEVRTSMWTSIKSRRDAMTENGGYKVGDKWFHSDQKSRSQQLGLVLLGPNIQSGLKWKTMDGSFVTMTPQLAQQILTAAAVSDAAIFEIAEAHKVAMLASGDPAAYDFSGGWPAVFVG